MKNNRRFLLIITVFGLIIYALNVSGCAPVKLYSVNLNYDATQVVIPAYLKAEGNAREVIISVAEFTDTRRIDDKKIIGRVIEKAREEVPDAAGVSYYTVADGSITRVDGAREVMEAMGVAAG